MSPKMVPSSMEGVNEALLELTASRSFAAGTRRTQASVAAGVDLAQFSAAVRLFHAPAGLPRMISVTMKIVPDWRIAEEMIGSSRA